MMVLPYSCSSEVLNPSNIRERFFVLYHTLAVSPLPRAVNVIPINYSDEIADDAEEAGLRDSAPAL